MVSPIECGVYFTFFNGGFYMSRVIAIVEDDVDQRDNYADALRNQGYEIITFGSRPEALAHFQNSGSQLPDLAILDIMLEKEMDGGFDLCRELRALSPNLPIIFLTARDSDIDRVSGLRLDAWDYLTKPLSPEVLGVRVATLFRIVESLSKGGVTSNPSEGVLHRGDLEIDPNSMSISWKGEHLNFTLTEFWLVEALARRPGMVKSYDNLMQVTRQTYVERNTINGYVRRVRRKFKEIDPSFEYIQTVFGVGYRWQPAE
ncbi:MAG: response regulator transcription factor [Arenicellales bacterium]|jgi:two-component system OmpR family response regulator|nr:response regulator transcription factor [Arenicellales bacterium]MDP6672485.1 response regulator transcription factor [Arenicellales bacterium]MDP6723648.1 response regulator transcription factor [Arenicellales bacterium]|tara:strand:+ start:25861 stop:26637 length:777 start_codon:yes stop_codon:yes gene_type:complete